jgi:uncharacterized tellurite resistance protein B-like protein
VTKPTKQNVNPVTDEAAQKFTAAVVFWCDVLGLGDWRIVVSDKRATRRVMAEVYKCDREQRSATIRLGKDFGPMEVTERNLSETALHECLHIFFHELIEFAKSDNASDDDVSSAEHRIINVLERVLSNASPLGPNP